MKIQTHKRHQFGKKFIFGNFPPVEFNEKGIAEVPEKTGQYIVKTHEMITLEGEKIAKKEVDNREVDITGDLSDLRAKLQESSDKLIRKEQEVDKLKGKLKVINEDLDAYKNLTNDLKKEIGGLNQTIETLQSKKVKEDEIVEAENKEDEKEDLEFSEEDIKFRDSLIEEHSKKELLKACEQYPEEEWKHFEQNKYVKKEVANYLTLKSKQQ